MLSIALPDNFAVTIDGRSLLALESFPVRLRIREGVLRVFLERYKQSPFMIDQITMDKNKILLLAEKMSRFVLSQDIEPILVSLGLKAQKKIEPPRIFTVKSLERFYSAFGLPAGRNVVLKDRVVLTRLPEKEARGFQMLFGSGDKYVKLLHLIVSTEHRGWQQMECYVNRHIIGIVLGRQIFYNHWAMKSGGGGYFSMTDKSNDPKWPLMEEDEKHPLADVINKITSLGLNRSGFIEKLLIP